MASSSSAYMHAAVAFSKVPGTLSVLTSQALKWTPSSSSSSVAAFTVKFSDISGLQTSKPGAAQIALMLALANNVQVAGKPKVLLVFNAAEKTALHDREKFKTELANAVARNRAVNSTPDPSTESPSASTAPATATATPTATAVATRTGTPSKASTPPQRAATVEKAPAKTELELRISVLRSNAQLRSLHKDVVLSGAMPDAEFWSHPQRQALIRAERANLEQRQGRNARLADPKPTPNEAGEMKLSITPELIRDLFEQFPVVRRAFDENVPAKMDESSFWTRYFQSKLYHRLRTSARSAASEHIVQDDPVFDQYLEDEDDQLEPRRQFNPHDQLLDLGATAEDHQETGNEKDWTMRAGAERRTLPLMRRFNDHSQSLLDSALGDEPRRRAPEDHYVQDIVIDDLNESERVDRVRLDVRDLEHYFQSRATDDHVAPADLIRSAAELDQAASKWTPHLGEMDPANSQRASAAMLANIHARTAARGANDIKSLPESVQSEVLAAHAAATEFLRQFWSAMAPQEGGQGGTRASRRERATKMQTSLARARDRIEAAARTAEEASGRVEDSNRVFTLLGPTIAAVQRALKTKV